MTLSGTTKATVQWMNGKQNTRVQCNAMSLCVYPSSMVNMVKVLEEQTKDNGDMESVWEPML